MSQQVILDCPEQDKKKGRAQKIDLIIGERLKKARKQQRLTQEDLAARLGISFQQIQKYENGKNRISFGRLYELSNYLSVPLDYFVKGISTPPESALEEDMPNVSQKETDELLKVYYSLDDPKLRKNLLKLVKSMAENMAD